MTHKYRSQEQRDRGVEALHRAPSVVPSGDFAADVTAAVTSQAEQQLRERIAAEIDAFADDHSDVSDAYRHAAMIAKGLPGA